MILFQVGVNAEIILPANYYEKQIESQRDAIVKAEQEDDQILKQYKYVVYDFSGNVIQGSINKDYADKYGITYIRMKKVTVSTTMQL